MAETRPKTIVEEMEAALKTLSGGLWNCKVALEGRAQTIMELEETNKKLRDSIDASGGPYHSWPAVADVLRQVADAAHSAVEYVGMANYAERQTHAHEMVNNSLVAAEKALKP